MKTIKLFDLQNGHYYAIGEPFNFVREGDKRWYIGLHGRVPISKRLRENDIDIRGVYGEKCYEDAFKP